MKTKELTYNRLTWPAFFEKGGPECPDCKGHLHYVGIRTIFMKLKPATYKVFQCRDCKSLFLEMPTEERARKLAGAMKEQ